MARPLFWLGIPGITEGDTGTNAVVVVRAVTNGVVIVNCNGDTFTETADTTVQDGLVRILVTGLTPDTKYTYTVTLPDTDSGSATLKTFPDTGNPKVAWYSCANSNANLPYITMHNEDPHCVICIGDFGYMKSGSSWGLEYPGVVLDGTNTDPDDFRQTERAHHARSYFRKMAENIPFAHVPDDHEWDINNVNWDLVSGNTANIDAFAEGTFDYMIGNPVNTDNPGDLKPFYFRFLCGNTEVFVLCAVMHGKDPMDVQRMVRDDSVDDDSGCLGRDALVTDIRNQENWLTSKIDASLKPWKLVLMPKQTLKSTAVNGDSWSAYPTEMNRVLQKIHDDSALRTVNAGGIVWGCGDWHSPGIHGSENGINGATYDHIAVTPCPFVGGVRDSGAPSIHTIFSYNGPFQAVGSNLDFFGLFGVFQPGSLKATSSIINFRGNVLASIDVQLGENKAAAADTDMDGVPDSIEDSNGNGVVDAGETDPLNPDSDNDGLIDGDEDANGNGTVDAGETDPLNTDSDSDGLSDGYEVNVIDSDPTSPTTVYTNPGDMNVDGDVDVGDLLLLEKKILGL